MTFINTPGVYAIDEASYHADPVSTPSLSNGVAQIILSDTLADAAHAHPRLNPAYESKDSTKYDLGSVAHIMLLDPGAPIAVIDAPNWMTKAAKQERDDAIALGHQPCLIHVYEQAECMIEALRHALAADGDNHTAFDPAYGKGEQAGVAKIEADGVPFWARAKADWLQKPVDGGGKTIIYDYKTWGQGSDPEAFVKYLYREYRDIQDPFYTLVFAKALGIHPADIEFRFVVQSAHEPYVPVVVQLDEQAQSLSFDRCRYAMARWATAMRDNHWPGRLPRTHFGAPPTYEITAWEHRMISEEFAQQLDARASDNEE